MENFLIILTICFYIILGSLAIGLILFILDMFHVLNIETIMQWQQHKREVFLKCDKYNKGNYQEFLKKFNETNLTVYGDSFENKSNDSGVYYYGLIKFNGEGMFLDIISFYKAMKYLEKRVLEEKNKNHKVIYPLFKNPKGHL